LPSIGRLVRYRPPKEMNEAGITVRNDTGVGEGDEISLYYDPMIAKLVTHAPTREQAVDAQADALDAFVIEGIRHNIPFLAALMAHPRWRAGKLSTGFIAEEFPQGFQPQVPKGDNELILAAVAAAVDMELGCRKQRIFGQLGQSSIFYRPTPRVVRLGDIERRFSIKPENGGKKVEFSDGTSVLIHGSRWAPGDLIWSDTLEALIKARGKRTDWLRQVTVQVRMIRNGFFLSCRGVEVAAQVYSETEAAYARLMPVKLAAERSKQVTCPMPGLVVSIAVEVGQEVKAGEPLAVVEAMKMENVLRAERDGTVKTISARPGDSLAVDAVIMEFA
jgi:propionyl-CoA carboxylase alpha chain